MNLRGVIQKNVELITQYSNLTKKPNINNVGYSQDEAGGSEDYMSEPAQDDVAAQALYAVYQKGMRFGKGKGKGKSGSGKADGGKGKKSNGRCLNCGKENHRTEDCRLPKVPVNERR